MKNFIVFILIVFVNTYILPQTSQVDSYITDLGRFKIPISNNGGLGYGGTTNSLEICSYDNKVVLFSGGFVMTGYRENNLWLNANLMSALIVDYVPGPIGFPSNDPRNRIYVINSTDAAFGNSWQDYKNAVQLGASFYDGNKDGKYNPIDLNGNGNWDLNEDCPDILGDVTAWCVYNDGVPKSVRRWNWNEPEGIEIHQTVFGFYGIDAVFIRYRIINRGTKASVLDSVIFSAWADFDIGKYEDDLNGCDTLLSLGYSYNFGADNEFGYNPPSIGVTLLQGPYAYIPGGSFIDVNSNGKFDDLIDIAIDTAVMKNGNLLKTVLIPGARNQNVISITGYDRLVGSGDPYDNRFMRCYQKGYVINCSKINVCAFLSGHVYGGINCSLVNPIYHYSGDPVHQVGWINTAPGDQRIMVNTGEFSLLKDEPVDIWAAYVVGRGTDHLTSITKMKQGAASAKCFYDDLPLILLENAELLYIPVYFRLFQNYPNPFNPITKIRYDLPQVGSRAYLLVNLKVYDLLGNEIAELVNEEKAPGSYEVIFDASKLASGVYIYKLETLGYLRFKKMMVLK